MLCGAVCLSGAFTFGLPVNTCGAASQLTQLGNYRKDLIDLKVSQAGSLSRNFQIRKGTVLLFLLLEGRTRQKSGGRLTPLPETQSVQRKGNLDCKCQEQNLQGAQVAEGTFYPPKPSITEAPGKKKAAGLRGGRRASEP